VLQNHGHDSLPPALGAKKARSQDPRKNHMRTRMLVKRYTKNVYEALKSVFISGRSFSL